MFSEQWNFWHYSLINWSASFMMQHILWQGRDEQKCHSLLQYSLMSVPFWVCLQLCRASIKITPFFYVYTKNNSRTEKPILIKCGIRDFYDKLSSDFSFHLDWTISMTTLSKSITFLWCNFPSVGHPTQKQMMQLF